MNLANVISFEDFTSSRKLEKTNYKISTKKEDEAKVPLSRAISLILNDIRANSENTMSNYSSNYNEFFEYTLNKNIGNVTWDDILTVTYDRVLDYRNHLMTKTDSPNSNKTINIKLASLNTLYKELYKIDRRIDVVAVDLKKLPETNDNQYGSLTESEVEALLKYTRSLPSHQKPTIKALFFETAYITAIRQGALLKLKWENVKSKTHIDKITGKQTNLWVIVVKDKGKVDETPIPNELYEKLSQELKPIMHSDGLRDKPADRVFNVTKKTLAKTLDDFCEFYGISKQDRNIVLHSLKKASVDKVYKETRDINITARHAHHSTVSQVYETYEGQNSGHLDRATMTVFNSEKNMLNLEDLSKEELLKAISKCGQHVINEISRMHTVK